MWVYSTSPPSLSLMGSLTTEIYYRTGITGNTNTNIHTHTRTHTHTHTYTQRLKLILPPIPYTIYIVYGSIGSTKEKLSMLDA